MKIRQWLLPESDTRNFGKMQGKYQYVTIHNTANRMPAQAESQYAHSGQGGVTYHFAVDDKEIIQLLPLTMTAWHAGDGRGNGNLKSIGIEICYSLDKGDRRYPPAEENAAWLAAKLLVDGNLNIDRLKKHQDWSGKYCPHRMLDNKGWEPFKRRVQEHMKELQNVTKLSTEDFILKIKDAAIQGWKTHQILPSLTIAQAILESASGNSELATKANALFGIKAHTDPSWSNVYKKETKEWSNGKYITITADFKAYKSWDESLKDRLTYLTTRKINGKYIYQSLIGEKDYKVAAQKIKDAGYATSPTYPQNLINLIEKYNLQKYDEVTGGDEKLNIDKIVIAYWNDGDLANALALLNVLGSRAVLTRTLDATEYKWSEVIQVGGTEIKGATKVLKGKNRNETLQKVAEYVKEK